MRSVYDILSSGSSCTGVSTGGLWSMAIKLRMSAMAYWIPLNATNAPIPRENQSQRSDIGGDAMLDLLCCTCCGGVCCCCCCLLHRGERAGLNACSEVVVCWLSKITVFLLLRRCYLFLLLLHDNTANHTNPSPCMLSTTLVPISRGEMLKGQSAPVEHRSRASSPAHHQHNPCIRTLNLRLL